MFAVVTGGGTSGHVMPALAIIEMLQEHGYSTTDIAYVGARRGIETTLLADLDIEKAFLPISGLQRSLSMRGIALNLVLPFRLLRSRLMARTLLKKWNPSVVVSVGGYASEPIAADAVSRGIPLVCVSYDRTAGLATRRQSRKATSCAVAFPDSSLPHAVLTGAPVRAQLRHLSVDASRDGARGRLNLPSDALVVTILGGSLGSGVLNGAVTDILQHCASLGNVAVFHICGDRFANSDVPHVPAGIVSYQRVGYERQMADVYAATDVLVARSGASTVAEIATIGIASILVPWKDAADNHQQLNAEWLSGNDAAYLASEQQCVNGELAHNVMTLLAHPDERMRLASAARAMGDMHRSSTLIDVIQNAAR
ncbi:MAG: UDP-N-acetylglucosamine--N-acetylmuramyl-(pentapeptide) pyrophosphoryl-undecaprenol N-acetylglucosamine transferase [Ilumatobacteraceae bacterium]